MQSWDVLIKRSQHCLIKAEGCIGSTLVHVMGCRLVSVKPSMRQSNTREQTQILVNFMSRKCIENVCKTSATIATASMRPSDAYMRQQTNHHWFR